ncbi:MAG TPA: hypothetical protein VMT58_08595 [Candidatus Binataceae bacterium]|nr:hypothetical protein [Candidatus Binataceae bacterium]
MAQFVVRNLEDSVKARLQRRTPRHRRSMEEEVRDILRNAIRSEERAAVALGSRLKARFAGIGLDSEIEELHGHKARTPVFKR